MVAKIFLLTALAVLTRASYIPQHSDLSSHQLDYGSSHLDLSSHGQELTAHDLSSHAQLSAHDLSNAHQFSAQELANHGIQLSSHDLGHSQLSSHDLSSHGQLSSHDLSAYSQFGHGDHESKDYHSHPRYEFSYGVKDDHTGDEKTHEETRDGDTVKGTYTVVDPDGHKRIVDYTADKHSGFNAVVRREKIDNFQEHKYEAKPHQSYKAIPHQSYEAVAHQSYEATPHQSYEAIAHQAYEATPHQSYEAIAHQAYETFPHQSFEAVSAPHQSYDAHGSYH